MMKMSKWLVMAGVAAALCLSANRGLAQNNGGPGQNFRNMSPEERQAAMMDNVKTQLEVKDDAEWKAIEPLVQKVMEARRTIGFGGPRGMFGGRGQRGGNAQGDQAQGQQRRGGMFGAQEPNPEAEALNKAIEAKASKAELKAALAKFVEARKAKQAALEKAQDDLRKVLTGRQEAIATYNGWL